MFDRFHRAGNAAGFSGSGLGLPIARAIVTAHGGTVGVTSPAGGTTCTAWLPAPG